MISTRNFFGDARCIRMHQCSNGQLLRELCSHTNPPNGRASEVVAILFNNQTDYIYSCNTRGELIVQEDDGEGAIDEEEAAAFLRSLQ